MHNAAFAARRVNAVLLPFLVADLKDFLASCPKLGVKGFAITLMVGLGANLITAVFVSRLIFDWHLQGKDRSFALSI